MLIVAAGVFLGGPPLTSSLAPRSMQSLFPLLVLLALFAFTMTQNRKRKMIAANLASSLVIGAKVMTAGGIYGTVKAIADDVVSLEIAPGTTIRIAKAAIGRVVETSIVDAVSPADELESAVSSTNDEDRA